MRCAFVLVSGLMLVGCRSGGASNTQPAIDALAQGIYGRLAPGKKISMAIVGFTPVAGAEEAEAAFSQYLVEELTMKLVNDGRVTVAERSQLDKVMKELRLQSSGAVSDSSAKQLGALLGVETVLLGTYMDLGKEMKINQRVIATESGEVLAASTANIRKNRTIIRLLRNKSRK